MHLYPDSLFLIIHTVRRTPLSEHAYNIVKLHDQGVTNISAGYQLQKDPTLIAQYLQFGISLCKYDPRSKRHKRMEVFDLFSLQETAPGSTQLVSKDMFMLLAVKMADHDVILEFMFNYLMPVDMNFDGSPLDPAEPQRGRGIMPASKGETTQVSFNRDWTTYCPMTQDLARAACPLAAGQAVKCNRFIGPLCSAAICPLPFLDLGLSQAYRGIVDT
jgi:hypothetical protein